MMKTWREEACAALREHIASVGKTTSAEFKKYAEFAGLQQPDELRSWGQPFRDLQKAGSIRKVGFTPSSERQAHGRPVQVWEVCQ